MLADKLLSHTRNIAHKSQIAKKPSDVILIEKTQEKFAEFIKSLDWHDTNPGWLQESVSGLNKYTAFVKEVEKASKFFNWRGGFASSLLPEFLYRILDFSLSCHGIDGLFSTKDSVVDVTLSGQKEGGWAIRRKDQDLCVGLRKDKILHSGGILEFVVPLVAIEAKTNIDINKLNGLDFSAERLKRTFPASRYFIATETLDFDLTKNYSGSIDEIYALRKQKRSAARKSVTTYDYQVFEDLADDVTSFVSKADVSKSHVYERLQGGKLINA